MILIGISSLGKNLVIRYGLAFLGLPTKAGPKDQIVIKMVMLQSRDYIYFDLGQSFYSLYFVGVSITCGQNKLHDISNFKVHSMDEN